MPNINTLKFNPADFDGKGITTLSDTPSEEGMSAQELKERFDQIPKMMIALDKFNKLIDALTSGTAGDTGASSIGLSTPGGTATNVQTNMQALWDAIARGGYGDMTKAVYDTQNRGIVDRSAISTLSEDSQKLSGKQASYFAPISYPVFSGDAQANSFIANAFNLPNSITITSVNGEMILQGAANTAHIRSNKGIVFENQTGSSYAPITVSACRVQELQSRDGGECSVTFIDSGNALVLQGGGQNSMQLRAPNIRCRDKTDAAWVAVYGEKFVIQSTRASKKDIHDIEDSEVLKFLNIKVKSFIYKEDPTNTIQCGVIAEEIQELGMESMLAYDEYGDLFGVDYSKFTPGLIRLFQIQQRKIDELERMVTEQEKRISLLEAK